MKTLYLVRDSYTKKFENLSKFSYLSKNFVLQDLPFNKKHSKLEYFLKQDKKFIYPLYIGSNKIFRNELPIPPTEVIDAVRKKKGYVVFFYLNEGNFHTYKEYKILENWTEKCNFNKENVYFFSGNHKSREVYDSLVKLGELKDTVNYYGTTYFESCLWSTKNTKRRNPEKIKILKEQLISNFASEKYEDKTYYFNCLNRKPRNERIFLTSLIKSFDTTSSLTSLSIGDESVLEGSYTLEEIPFNKTIIRNPTELLTVTKFIEKNFDSMKNNGYSLDFKDLGKPGSDRFDPNFYRTSFASIVVETEHSNKIMFLSEKTFKPILMFHPFFLIGNKHSLKFLKELGYKTFDKWWDESYDNYDNIYDRIYYAFKEIKRICNLDKKTLSYIVQDMYSVLRHNFNHYFDNKRFVEEYNPVLNKL